MIDNSAVGLPMMLFSVLALLPAIPLVIFAVVRGRRDLLHKLGMAAALWGGVYAIVLLLASLTSSERTLPIGERHSFCGFYLDCHIGARVDRVTFAETISTPTGVLSADDIFHIALVTYDSDAREKSLRLNPAPLVQFVDGNRNLSPHPQATTAIRRDLGLSPEPVGQLAPSGGSIATVYVFDAPRSANARLLVSDGHPINRVIEWFLIGDDDSLLHARTYLALRPHE